MACGVPQKCAEKYAAVIRLYIILLLLPAAGGAIFCLLRFGIIAAIIPAALSAACGWAVFCLPDMYIDAMSYTRHRDWLLVEKGMLWRRSVLVPRRQIQYVKLKRGPVERLFGLCGIVIITSGGRVTISGLLPEEGVRLRELMERGLAA